MRVWSFQWLKIITIPFNSFNLVCCSNKKDGLFLIVKQTFGGIQDCCNGEKYYTRTHMCGRDDFGLKEILPKY